MNEKHQAFMYKKAPAHLIDDMLEKHALNHPEIADKLNRWQVKKEFWMLRAEIPAHHSVTHKANIRKIFKTIEDFWVLSPSEKRIFNSQLAAIDLSLNNKQLPNHVMVEFCTAIQGKGLYAAEDIPPGQLIGLYTGIITTDEETIDGNRYLFGIGKGYSIDAANCGNYTRAINNTTGRYANASAYKVKLPGNPVPQIAILSSKKIKNGQQILFSYGRQYFKALEIKPLILTPDTL